MPQQHATRCERQRALHLRLPEDVMRECDDSAFFYVESHMQLPGHRIAWTKAAHAQMHELGDAELRDNRHLESILLY